MGGAYKLSLLNIEPGSLGVSQVQLPHGPPNWLIRMCPPVLGLHRHTSKLPRTDPQGPTDTPKDTHSAWHVHVPVLVEAPYPHTPSPHTHTLQRSLPPTGQPLLEQQPPEGGIPRSCPLLSPLPVTVSSTHQVPRNVCSLNECTHTLTHTHIL